MLSLGALFPASVKVCLRVGTLSCEVLADGQSNQAGKRSSTVSLDIAADGVSQLLSISTYNEDTSVFKRKKPGSSTIRRTDSSDSIATSAFEAVPTTDKPTMSISVDFSGIGLSVVTKKPSELVYLSLRGLKIQFEEYPKYRDFSLDCQWIQLDNQLFGGEFPIILYPATDLTSSSEKDLAVQPTFHGRVVVSKDLCRLLIYCLNPLTCPAHGVQVFDGLELRLQTMAVQVDEDLLWAAFEFSQFKDASWGEETPECVCAGFREGLADGSVLIEHPKDIPEPDLHHTGADYFFQEFRIHPIHLEASFKKTDRINTIDEKWVNRGCVAHVQNVVSESLVYHPQRGPHGCRES